jgi:hypothetical protein
LAQHASLGSSEDPKIRSTISAPAPDRQAAKEAAHIARLVAAAPPLTDAQIDRIAVLLRPRAERANATPAISAAQYQSLEYRRYLDAETAPYGYFTAGGEAA